MIAVTSKLSASNPWWVALGLILPLMGAGCDEPCEGGDGSCETQAPCEGQDEDGDGYSCDLAGGDCDDSDPNVRPGAAEVAYDGIDQDCDGQDAIDLDGDGYCGTREGAGEQPYHSDRALCPNPGVDCVDEPLSADPSSDDVHPGAPEGAEVDGQLQCDGVDNDCDGNIDNGTRCWDDDGDGVSEQDGDCDDTDIEVAPGAPEGIDRDGDGVVEGNGIDDNCDGVTDEGTDRSDDDGDGFCENDEECEGGATPGDCDDTDIQYFPGAAEEPYSADLNCDGVVDMDLDNDGWPIDGTPPDCDDSDPAINPGQVEIPYDGEDQNCDGVNPTDFDDDGDPATVVGGGDCDDQDPTRSSLMEEIPYDGKDQDCDGVDLEDVDGDGFAAALVDGPDCDDEDAAVQPRRIDWFEREPLSPVDSNCDGVLDVAPQAAGEARLTIDGKGALERVGSWVRAGDLDGDGALDLVVGAPGNLDPEGEEGPGSVPGHVAIWFGLEWSTLRADVGVDHLPPPDLRIDGELAGERFASGGEIADLDGDGVDDLIVAIPGYAEGIGAVLVIPGDESLGESGSVSGVTISRLNHHVIAGECLGSCSDSEHFGQSLAARDLTGDGAAELVVGAPRGRGNKGAAYLLGAEQIMGGACAPLCSVGALLGQGAQRAEGGAIDGRFAFGVAIGDFDLDAQPDVAVLVGNRLDSSNKLPGVKLWFGAGGLDLSAAADHVILRDTHPERQAFLWAAASLPLGEGAGDVLALVKEAPGVDYNPEQGPPPTTIHLMAPTAEGMPLYLDDGAGGGVPTVSSPNGVRLGVGRVTAASPLSVEEVVRPVMAIGDLNGDGELELAVADPLLDQSQGGVWLLREVEGLLSQGGDLSLAGAALAGEAASVLAGDGLYARDLDADGIEELLVSSTGQVTGEEQSPAGAVHLYWGME